MITHCIRAGAVAVLWLPLTAAAQTRTVGQDTTVRRADRPATQSASATDSTRPATLRPVTVTVTRESARSPLDLPFATTHLTPDATRPGVRHLSLNDLLVGVPGLIVQDRANPAQDPRLSLRGFGARSAFGVRGVRVLRDGLPVSLPDGQTPVDWLDLESVGSIDVVRGTAAALYGNAAGGVVDLRTRMPGPEPLAVDARWSNGGGVARTSASIAAAQKPPPEAAPSTASIRDAGALLTITQTKGPGVRTWSQLDAQHAFARVFATVRGTRVEVQGTRYASSRAESPGALTASELSRDVTLPDSLNITKRARKAAVQEQVAVRVSRDGMRGSIEAQAFTGTRTLDNPLPFAIVAVDRAVSGASLRGDVRLNSLPWPLRFAAGVDAQRQDDARLNYENCADATTTTAKCPTAGRERGAVRLDQREQVRGIGAFARAEAALPHNLLLSAAVRRDQVAFRVTDRVISATNPDDSGDRTLAATTPMVGIVWRPRQTLSVFANATTAFETPTITELTNQVDGSAGLNRALLPQRTRTLEVGGQALLGGHVQLDLAVFRAVVQDELVPFDVPNAPGRKAYRNAGQTSRRGLESSVRALWVGFETGVSYTASQFRFDRYVVGTTSYAGNPIPGIPPQVLQGWMTARRGAWFGTVETTMAARATADDAALVSAAGYAVWGFRTGLTAHAVRGRWLVEPTAGVDNVFDRHYAPSVVINATRSRYYEPGLPRRVFIAVRVRGA